MIKLTCQKDARGHLTYDIESDVPVRTSATLGPSGHLVLYVYLDVAYDGAQDPIMCIDSNSTAVDVQTKMEWDDTDPGHGWCAAHATASDADLPPTQPTSAPVRFLRGLSHLIELNEKSTIRHAPPGTLLQRLYGSLNDDRDQTIVSLLGAGFETGDAEKACADMGLLDGE